MKPLNIKEIANVLNVDCKCPNHVTITKVTSGYKNITDNTLIFHLNRATDIKTEIVKKHKNCYIVTDQPLLVGTNISRNRLLFVENVDAAYRRFISYYRALFSLPVVAVTGTCGKTTTKEMIAQVLRQRFKVVATVRSKNGLRHYLKYLLQIDDGTDYAVFETALTHPGHIVMGCEYMKPVIGIITKIGIDHLNYCLNPQLYTKTKGEIIAGLGNKGTLIINGDCENIKKIDFSIYNGKIITFGIENKADYRAGNYQYRKRGMRFTLEHNHQEYRVYVPGLGKHNIYNALAALAALHCLGLDLNEAIANLKEYKPLRSHTEIIAGRNESILIDDTWSSNPTSLTAALDVLNTVGRHKTKIVVIGKISYLGKHWNYYYRKIGRELAQSQLNRLFTFGKGSAKIGGYARMAGMNEGDISHYDNIREMIKTIKPLLKPDTVVLFKTSMLDYDFKTIFEEIKK